MLSKNNEQDKILLFIVCCTVTLLSANMAKATDGDIYAQGTIYNAATYSTHPSYFGYSNKLNVVDLNVGSGSDDCNLPLYAPEPGGTVAKIFINDSGWGNAITWTKDSESIFMAHLSSFGNDGSVNGGDVIGYVGTTGNSTSCHLHIESNQGTLVLSGNQIIPEYWYNGPAYTSDGPIDDPDDPPNPPPGDADISIDDVTLSEAGDDNYKHEFTITAGESFKFDIEADVDNKKSDDVEVDIYYYWDDDKNFSYTSSHLLGEDLDVTIEGDGDVKKHLRNIQAPSEIGTYYYYLYVVAPGDTDKSSETNSAEYGKIVVEPPRYPDLVITAFSMDDAELQVSQEFTINITAQFFIDKSRKMLYGLQ